MEQDSSLPEEETVIHEHTRKKKATHKALFKGLKVERVVIPLPEEDQICPVCGTRMVLIGEDMSAVNWNSFLPHVKCSNTTAKAMDVHPVRKYLAIRKTCDHKIPGSGSPGRKRTSDRIHCHMDDVSKIR